MSKSIEDKTIRKQSIIAGGLITSAGLFFAKFIGLFYAIPFNTMLGTNENIAIYGVSYSIYSYLLNICIAGFPFAIATLVAKYSSRGDYETSLLIRKLATQIMVGLGFVAMLFLFVFSGPFSNTLLPEEATNLSVMKNVLMIISLALFFVPILSSMRGFYQGLKHMEVYALSQVLEQIARVAFLLLASGIAVYIFKADHIWSVYFGAFSTSFAAILAILHMRLYDKKQMKYIKALAKKQEVCANRQKSVIAKELLFISFPYLLAALLGYSDTLINTFFLKSGLEAYYLRIQNDGTHILSLAHSQEMLTIIGTINYSILKLMSIPMILAPGFSGAIIPHIASSIAQNDTVTLRKNIKDCIHIVLYIGLPLCFCLYLFSQALFVCLFPPADSDSLLISTQVLEWFSIEAFLSTFGPIVTAIMMAVNLQKKNIKRLFIMVVIKFITAYPLLYFFGFKGMVLSSILSMGVFIYLNLKTLTMQFRITWKTTIKILVIIVLGMGVMFAVVHIFQLFSINGYNDASRLINVLHLSIVGFFTLLSYFLFTYIFGLPQKLLHFKFSRLTKRFFRK